MDLSISIDVSYGQIALFNSDLENPFNDWTEAHVIQGFAWRPGSVSFRTILDAGLHSINISVGKHMGAIASDALRVIQVPFDIPDYATIELASIGDSLPLEIPPGGYLLRCEILMIADGEKPRINLLFSSEEIPHFSVLRSDEDLGKQELVTDAQPALT